MLYSAAMSAKAISEQTGKEFLYKYICTSAAVQNRFRYASVTADTDWDRLTQEHPWLLTEVMLPCCDQYTLWIVTRLKIWRLLVMLLTLTEGQQKPLCSYHQKVVTFFQNFVSQCIIQVCTHLTLHITP